MYSACLFCRAPLGANEMIEHFPVGRRIAFDAAKGRLWVVCPTCKQWCLSPLDERWEAVEEAERIYRESRLRTSTDQIGLARLRDGTDLVRIGEPMRPEFAAWRYGARFGARWRRNVALIGAASVATGAYIIAGPVLGLIAGGVGVVPWNLAQWVQRRLYSRRVVARLDRATGPVIMTDAQARGARLRAVSRTEGTWELEVPHLREDLRPGQFTPRTTGDSDPVVLLAGEEALHAARLILPRINRTGGTARTVADAVTFLEHAGSADVSFARVAAGEWDRGATTIASVERPLRLALEMAAHEETERRALAGELAALEAAWKEAEEVAAIADQLTLPERIGEHLDRLRR